MSTDGTTPSQEGTRAAVAGLLLLGGVAAAVVALVISAGQWADDGPGASLAGGGSGSEEVAPPVPLTAGETYIVTEVLPSGDLKVTQWVESSKPLESVLLARPDLDGLAELKAEQVSVVADGLIVSGPDRISMLAGRYEFPSTTSVEIRYLLTGAVKASSSAPGRALAWPTSLDVSYEPASESVTRTVIAPEVLSLACSPLSTTKSDRPCGVRDSDGAWTVELEPPHAADRVMAQLTIE
jgi:hypothetical protein